MNTRKCISPLNVQDLKIFHWIQSMYYIIKCSRFPDCLLNTRGVYLHLVFKISRFFNKHRKCISQCSVQDSSMNTTPISMVCLYYILRNRHPDQQCIFNWNKWVSHDWKVNYKVCQYCLIKFTLRFYNSPNRMLKRDSQRNTRSMCRLFSWYCRFIIKSSLEIFLIWLFLCFFLFFFAFALENFQISLYEVDILYCYGWNNRLRQ